MGDLRTYPNATRYIISLLLLCVSHSLAAPAQQALPPAAQKSGSANPNGYAMRCRGEICVTTMPGKTCVSKCRGNRCLTECHATNARNLAQAKRSPKSLLKTKQTRSANELLTLGVNYIFPTLKFQFGISKHWSLGLTSLLLHSLSAHDSSAKGYGIMLGINYYLDSLYSGFWAEIGPGINFLQHSPSGNLTNSTFGSAMANIGWRWNWPSGFNFGVGGGVHFIAYDSSTANALQSCRFYPSAVLDLGFSF